MKTLTRRAALRWASAGGLSLAMPLSFAQSVKVDVVKIMSFSCGVCYASESQDIAIEREVKKTGGRFVAAPIPTVEEDTGAAALLFYAARDKSPALASSVKASLYKGIQEMGQALHDVSRVVAWLEQDMPESAEVIQAVAPSIQSDEVRAALGRAFRLVRTVGVQRVPTYILVVNGEPTAALDPSSSGNGTLTSLRDEIIKRIQSYASTNS